MLKLARGARLPTCTVTPCPHGKQPAVGVAVSTAAARPGLKASRSASMALQVASALGELRAPWRAGLEAGQVRLPVPLRRTHGRRPDGDGKVCRRRRQNDAGMYVCTIR